MPASALSLISWEAFFSWKVSPSLYKGVGAKVGSVIIGAADGAMVIGPTADGTESAALATHVNDMMTRVATVDERYLFTEILLECSQMTT